MISSVSNPCRQAVRASASAGSLAATLQARHPPKGRASGRRGEAAPGGESCARRATGRTPGATRAMQSWESAAGRRRRRAPRRPRKAGLSRAHGRGPALEICGSPDRATTCQVASPAFVRTRYSRLIDADDRPVDGVLSLAGGDEQVPRPVRTGTRFPDSAQLSTCVCGATSFVPCQSSHTAVQRTSRLPQSRE